MDDSTRVGYDPVPTDCQAGDIYILSTDWVNAAYQFYNNVTIHLQANFTPANEFYLMVQQDIETSFFLIGIVWDTQTLYCIDSDSNHIACSLETSTYATYQRMNVNYVGDVGTVGTLSISFVPGAGGSPFFTLSAYAIMADLTLSYEYPDPVRCPITNCASCTAGTYSPTPGASGCLQCASCSVHATTTQACSAGANTQCSCNVGYYGNGLTCTACKTCPANATLTTACPANSLTDASACQCNTGFYGNGLTCTACKTCPANATLTTACPANSALDTSRCQCDAGFLGNGTECTLCPANFFCRAGGASQEACPFPTWSPPGARSPLDCRCNPGFACTYARKLHVVVTLNCTEEDFASNRNNVRTDLIQAIANASHVDPSQVVVQGLKARVRSLVHHRHHSEGLEISVAVSGATRLLGLRLLHEWRKAHSVSFHVRHFDVRAVAVFT